MGPTTQVQGETPCSPKTFARPRDRSLGFMKRCLPIPGRRPRSPSGPGLRTQSLSPGPGRRCLEGAELHQRRRPRLRKAISGDNKRRIRASGISGRKCGPSRGLQRGDPDFLPRRWGSRRISATLYQERAMARFKDGQIPEAVTDFDRANELDPPDPHRRTGSGVWPLFYPAPPRENSSLNCTNGESPTSENAQSPGTSPAWPGLKPRSRKKQIIGVTGRRPCPHGGDPGIVCRDRDPKDVAGGPPRRPRMPRKNRRRILREPVSGIVLRPPRKVGRCSQSIKAAVSLSPPGITWARGRFIFNS